MKPTDRQLAALAMTLVVSWLTHVPASAQAEDPYAYEDEYRSGDYGRVTHQENGVTIHRAFEDPGLPPVSEAGVNSPVYPGDALLTGAEQRAEIQLASGTLVRVDRATDVTFLSLPDPYAEFPDSSVLQLAEGALRITTRLEEGEELRVDTPASSIYFLGDGDFRIEVTPGGRSEVISRRGVAEVVGNGGSILVQGGKRTEVFPGTLPEEAWAFNTFVTDDFDRWVDERDAIYRVRDRYPGAPDYSAETYDALPAEVQPYYQELSYHGDWTYDDEYGYVWYPTAAPADWRPYYDGYWDYGPGGYFWVSYEPWGWAPYHYGRWNWIVGYGWCWVPGRVFSGAWVAWSWGSVHVGWAPIDYWGRPSHVRGIYYGYYDPHAWTFVDYAHLDHRNYHRHAVRVDDIGADIRHATVVTRAPRVSPTRLASSHEARVKAMRMAEEDRSGRMRPVDRSARPTLTMNEVEQRLRGPATDRRGDSRASRMAEDRSRATAPRDGAPSRAREDRATGRRPSTARRPDRAGATGSPSRERASGPGGRDYPSYPRRLSQDRSRTSAGDRGTAGRRSPASSERREAGAGTERSAPSTRVRPRETERAGTDQRVRDLYRKMASPRSTRDDGAASGRRPTKPGSRVDRSGRSQRDTSSQRSRVNSPSRTERRTTGNQRTTPSRSRSPERKQDDRSSGGNRGSRSRTTDKKRNEQRSQSPGTSVRSSRPRSGSSGRQRVQDNRHTPSRSDTRLPSTTRSRPSAPARSSTTTGPRTSRPTPRPGTRSTGRSRSTVRSLRSNGPTSQRSSPGRSSPAKSTGSQTTSSGSRSSGSRRSTASPGRSGGSRAKSDSRGGSRGNSSRKSGDRGKKR